MFYTLRTVPDRVYLSVLCSYRVTLFTSKDVSGESPFLGSTIIRMVVLDTTWSLFKLGYSS